MQRFNELTCTVTTEYLTTSGEVQKRCSFPNTQLVLGRNEFGDMLLQLCTGKQVIMLNLKNSSIFQRFVKEGKATIKILKPSMHVMISNCPPDRLKMFLQVLLIKSNCQGEQIRSKQTLRPPMLLTDVTKRFTDISPLSLNNMNTIHQQRIDKEEKINSITTPTGKRKRNPNTDKENSGSEGISVGSRRKIVCKEAERPAVNVLRPPLKGLALCCEQQQVLSTVLSGCNLFFTGSAGTGKSYLIKRILGSLPPKNTFATASTGVAACHIGGITLHAFAGIGSGEADLSRCVELASRSVFLQQWKSCKHLIIDEVSMIDGHLFDKLEAVARSIRQSSKPFGGIQLILCGDFLQLPPVTKPGSKRKFAFQSSSWKKCISKHLELKQVHRQTDRKFIDILQNIRVGRCTDEAVNCLKSTACLRVDRTGIVATQLCTHKDDVDNINRSQLRQLKTKSHRFTATDSDPSLAFGADEACAVSSVIELKQGAQVMLTKNLDVSKGLVNGARGIVVDFEPGTQGFPLVKFLSGEEPQYIRPEKWPVKLPGGLSMDRWQLPLKLAWALSIHKSQGMTLDCVEISLSRVFECGQAYVALSRAKSLDGLRVIDFDRRCVKADTDVLKFYQQIVQ